MRHLLALGAACALAGAATAQSGTATGTVSTSRLGSGGAPASMPGQAVGSGFSLPAGFGSVGQPVGQKLPPVGNGMSRPYDPARPLDVFKGTGIDPKNVVTPLSALPPAPPPQTDLVDRLYAKLGSVFSLTRPTATATTPPPPNVTPGIFRRNRERADERAWRRD